MVGYCIYIGFYEMELLRDIGIMVVMNLELNMGNVVGCLFVMCMFNEYGILMGFGIDGYMNDVMEFYKVGNVIYKYYLVDLNVVWVEIFIMLFDNNL